MPTRVLLSLKIHVKVKVTHAVRRSILASSAHGAERRRSGRTRRGTRDCCRSSSIHALEPPGHAADHPRPTPPTHPTHKACEERKRPPHSSCCTLLVVGKAASPVADAISEVLQLRCAVEEVEGEVLHNADRLGARHMMYWAAARQKLCEVVGPVFGSLPGPWHGPPALTMQRSLSERPSLDEDAERSLRSRGQHGPMNAAFSKRERVHRNVPLLVLFSRAPHHFEKKATDVRKQGLPPTKVTTRTLFTCLTHHESVISPPSSGPLRTITAGEGRAL